METNYMDILARLHKAAKSHSDRELAEKIGVSKQSIADAKARKTVPSSWIPRAAQLFDVSTDWLFFGKKAEKQEKSGKSSSCDVDLIMIPLVEARLSAGVGSLEVGSSVERSYAFRSDFLLRKGNPGKMVLMRVSGDSMQPEIMNNDIVLIDQGKTDILPGRIFAVGFDDAIYLKRIDKLPGKVILKSANPEYPPIEMDVRDQLGESFRVIGQVLWSGREY